MTRAKAIKLCQQPHEWLIRYYKGLLGNHGAQAEDLAAETLKWAFGYPKAIAVVPKRFFWRKLKEDARKRAQRYLDYGWAGNVQQLPEKRDSDDRDMAGYDHPSLWPSSMCVRIIEYEYMRVDVRMALSRLSPENRLLAEKKADGYSLEEIGNLFFGGMSPSQVHRRWQNKVVPEFKKLMKDYDRGVVSLIAMERGANYVGLNPACRSTVFVTVTRPPVKPDDVNASLHQQQVSKVDINVMAQAPNGDWAGKLNGQRTSAEVHVAGAV